MKHEYYVVVHKVVGGFNGVLDVEFMTVEAMSMKEACEKAYERLDIVGTAKQHVSRISVYDCVYGYLEAHKPATNSTAAITVLPDKKKITNSNLPICKNCLFYVPKKEAPEGYCHRYPPQNHMNEYYRFHTSLPIVEEDDFCGEFR